MLRFPRWGDLKQCLTFVNKISKEDTFTIFSGERITKSEEEEWLLGVIKSLKAKDALYLFALLGTRLIGNCELNRDMRFRRRSRHVGHLGIILDREYRDEGIGTEMIRTLLGYAKDYKFKILKLSVFDNNLRAIHTYEKLGFKKCGVIPKVIMYKNRLVDEVIMFKEAV